MNIFVFVKRVPDTESKIRIDQDKAAIQEEGLNFVMSPYDEYAVEEALRLKEAHGGQVRVFSIGSDATQVVLKKALAMGADEAVLIKDEAAETYDGLRTARVIAKCLKTKYTEYDLLLFGKQSVGADNSQVPAMVAALLDLPQANVVVKLDVSGNAVTVHREIEGASELVTMGLPAVVSAQKGLNEPRYETLKGIMAAKRKQIPVLTPDELGVEAGDLNPGLILKKLESPPPREAGRIIDDEAESAAKQLAEYLRHEAKVI